MKRDKQLIEFAIFEDHKGVAKIPSPARSYIPKWYKDVPLREPNSEIYERKVTIKACAPFLDTLTSGYIFELWTDLQIIQDETDGFKNFAWGSEEYNLIDIRQDYVIGDFPAKEGYLKPRAAITLPLYVKTPPGYSVLITSPFNRNDLPMVALTGIVDTDVNPLYPGKYPFMLNDSVDGVIESGTPLIQIIPFKRTEWDSKENDEIKHEAEIMKKRSKSVFGGWYKKNSHIKKVYN